MKKLAAYKFEIWLGALLASSATAVYLVYDSTLLQKEITGLLLENASQSGKILEARRELASTTAKLENEIADLKKEGDFLRTDLETEKGKIGFLSGQVDTLGSAVNILEKINSLDPELLKKYSKVYFLNENYYPADLFSIDPGYGIDPKKNLKILPEAWVFLKNLLDEADSDGIDIKIISAYRSFGEQSAIKSNYKVLYGSGANQFSADQGYSEHQLGTAVDFTTSATGENFSAFDGTPAFKWLTQNAHKYGFALSYPEENVYYKYEPWHWRFVGRGLANQLYLDGKNFYDLDQRLIDQHLLFIFD